MVALLDKNEALLEMLGRRLVEIDYSQNKEFATNLLSEQVKINDDLFALGLVLPTGQLVLTSSNITPSDVPNFLTTKETSDSFTKTLNSDVMVVGRTYYLEALQDWVIPIRKRILDNNNKTIAVMAAALKLESVTSPWSNAAVPEHLRIRILKSDFSRQYYSHVNEQDFNAIYNAPISEKKIELLNKQIQEQTGETLASIIDSKQSFIVKGPDHDLAEAISSLSYNQKYGLYTFVATHTSTLQNELISRSSWYVIFLLMFNTALYFLFHFNVSTEKNQNMILNFKLTMIC